MADQPKLFPPSPEFSKNAWIKSLDEYEALYKRSVEDPEGYWAERAEDALVWTKKWDKVLDWSFDPVPYIKWFEGGELNASYNCLDRHVEAGKGDKPAIVFEGDPGDTKTCTFKELLDEVSKFANVLKKHGVKKGDRVALYLPMIAELPVVMLACARIGAIHMMVFGGFSAEALKARIDNCGAKVLDLRRQGLPRRQDDALEDQRRRRHQRRDDGREGHRHQARRRRRAHDRRPRRLVPRRDGSPRHHRRLPAACRSTPSIRSSSSTRRARRARPRACCTAPAGYLLLRARHVQVRVRPARRRHPLLHGRHRLDHRAQLHRVRAAQHGRHQRPLRGPADVPRAGPLLAGRREAQDDHHLHRARPSSAASSARATSGSTSTTCRRSASWLPSASRSTPTAGSGTTRRSARAACRCSTRGGRPRRAGT